MKPFANTVFFLCLTTTQAEAKPPSYWEVLAGSQAEGLTIRQEAMRSYARQEFDLALQYAQVAHGLFPSEEGDSLYYQIYYDWIFNSQTVPPQEDVERMCQVVLPGFKKLLDSAPRFEQSDLMFNAGLCAALVGELELAIELNIAHLHHPNIVDALPQQQITLLNLGDIWMARGELERARVSYEAADKVYPGGNASYLAFSLAVAHWRSGNIQEAATQAQRGLSLDPYLDSLLEALYIPPEEALFFLALAYAAAGEPALARPMLGQYLLRAPQGSYRDKAREAFDDIEKFSESLQLPTQ